jgi:hypothetical protein
MAVPQSYPAMPTESRHAAEVRWFSAPEATYKSSERALRSRMSQYELHGAGRPAAVRISNQRCCPSFQRVRHGPTRDAERGERECDRPEMRADNTDQQ